MQLIKLAVVKNPGEGNRMGLLDDKSDKQLFFELSISLRQPTNAVLRF